MKNRPLSVRSAVLFASAAIALALAACGGKGMPPVAGPTSPGPGVVTEYPIPTADSVPLGITAGPDGNLWFTEWGVDKIGKITTGGTITGYPVPTANAQPEGITAGPDGNLWFTESASNKIGKITP